tara:strand:- start:698 stop:964 length:267 start_codon:yes stop_codon:yes gene_type:complete
MEKKDSIFIPVRLATRTEIEELTCGTLHCPACDSQLMGRDLMNKMPILNKKNMLDGWICQICDSVFDLQDRMVDIGEFDLFDQEIAEA